MKRYIFLGVAVALFGALGFAAERFLFNAAPVEGTTANHGQPAQPATPTLYKMPLGKFTMRVTKRRKTLHLLLNIDVYIRGAASFEAINGAIGRARLRDGTITAIADIAENAIWMERGQATDQEKHELVEQLVRKLNREFPSVVTARINQFSSSVSVREIPGRDLTER